MEYWMQEFVRLTLGRNFTFQEKFPVQVEYLHNRWTWYKEQVLEVPVKT